MVVGEDMMSQLVGCMVQDSTPPKMFYIIRSSFLSGWFFQQSCCLNIVSAVSVFNCHNEVETHRILRQKKDPIYPFVHINFA